MTEPGGRGPEEGRWFERIDRDLDDVEYSVRVRPYEGPPGMAIKEIVEEMGADLVVVGTHGRRGIGRVLLGSGAEDVIRQAPVPVLVIRAPAAEAAA